VECRAYLHLGVKEFAVLTEGRGRSAETDENGEDVEREDKRAIFSAAAHARRAADLSPRLSAPQEVTAA
jgi:antirestriction protein ArdC